MKVVKNDIVEMDWDAAGFIESKKHGFIAAIHEYNGIPLAFKDGKIYTHLEGDEVVTLKDFVSRIKQAVKTDDVDYPDYYDDYYEIYDGVEFNDTLLERLGLTQFTEDMLARIEDLSGYWFIIETSM